MAVSVKFIGDADKIVRETKKFEKSAKDVDIEFQRLVASSKEMERYSKKAFREALEPAEQYKRKLDGLKRAYQTGKLTQDEFRQGIVKLNSEFTSHENVGVSALTAIREHIGLVVTSIGSVGGAIALLKSGYATWIENTKEVANQTTEAAKSMRAFLAIQEPGKRGQAAIEALDVMSGVGTMYERLDTIQALQSATGSREQALEIGRAIKESVLLGNELPLAKEIAVQAISQNNDPIQWLRLFQAAGDASARTTKELAPAAQGLPFFEDKQLGIAASIQLLGTYPTQIKEMAKSAGIALSSIGGGGGDWYKKQGLGADATERQRLDALVRAGIDTTSELYEAGFRDNQVVALKSIISNYGKMMGDSGLAGIEKALADTDMLSSRRQSIEAEMPTMKLARQIEETQSQFETSRAMDANAQAWDLWQKTLAAELSRRGIRGGFGDYYDAEGNMNLEWGGPWSWDWELPQADARSQFGGPVTGSPRARAMSEARREADRVYQEALKNIEQNTQKTSRPRVPAPE